MHCTNCGTYIAPGARFCAGCGTPAADPEATRYAGAQPFAPPPGYAQQVQAPPPAAYAPARPERAGEAEKVIFKTRPTLLFIKIGYGLAALGAIILVWLLASYTPLPTWISVLLALALLLIPAYYHVKRNLVDYTLTNYKLEISQGFFTRTTRNYPLRQIQDVTLEVSIMQRLLGYGNVIIENAGDDENLDETRLHNIHNPRQYADMLLRELRRFR